MNHLGLRSRLFFEDDVIRTSGVDGAKDVGVNGSEMTDWWNLSNK